MVRMIRARSMWLPVMVCLFLSACASSDVSRTFSSNVDMGTKNARGLYEGSTNGDVANTYQNTSQATKGGMIGGAAGAVTGAAYSSSVGFLPGLAAGAILGATYGSYIDANSSLEDKLINRGANVIVLGDQIMVAIPSARIFNPFSANINPTAYSTLELVSQFINSYTKMLVKVAVYTNNQDSERANLALSKEQAKNVAKFLLMSGVDARLLVAQGYGGTSLVESSAKDWEGSDNYRIEITLEKLQV